MSGQKIIKKGYLDSCPKAKEGNSQKEEWKRRYYVLYSSTETNKARLDWFNDEKAFEDSPTVRKTIFVEEINKISPTDIPNHNHGFQISTLRRKEPFWFSAYNKHEKKEWIDQLKKVIEKGKRETPARQPKGGENDLGDGVYGNQLWGLDEKPIEYEVTVGETPSAANCNLNKKIRTLQLFSNCMALVHKEERDKLLFVWPYKYIRRYGRSKASFTFEAGRRCASGEGVFILLTSNAEEIFADIQKANDQDQDESAPPALPSVPVRNYGEHYGEVIAQNRQHQDRDYTKLNSDGDWTTQDGHRRSGSGGARPPPLPSGPPERRERSMSSSSSGGSSGRNLPPVPPGARPGLPLPPGGAGRGQAPPSGAAGVVYSDISSQRDYAYSSVEERKNIAPVVPGGTDYDYSEPVVPQGSSMSAIIAQMRLANPQGDADEDEYDKVTINVLKRDDENVDTVPEAYGYLYGELGNQNQKKTAGKKTDEEQLYQEVNERR